MKELHPDNHFLSVDGKSVSNIKELIAVLESMDEIHFKHHVNEEKNDFSTWVRDCFHDNTLADELTKIHTKDEMISIIIHYMEINADINPLISGNVKEKIKWYIKAHGHSSMGSLNLIWTYLDFIGDKEKADKIAKAVKAFENFGESDNFRKELDALENTIDNVEKVINHEENEEKRMEMVSLIYSVKRNLYRIEDIIKDPGYQEGFKLSKILFSAAIQLERQYPNTLYGDIVGNKGEYIGDRIKLNVKEPAEEEEIQCCGYEMQLLLFNLLSNAVDAINDKGNIYIEITYSKGIVRIDVSDDGKLISEEDIKKIAAHKEFSTKSRGHGRGLKIVNDILEKYNGALDLASDTSKHQVTCSIAIPLR